MKKIFISLIVLDILTACVPIDRQYYIYLKNNSNIGIWYLTNYNFPDTLLPDSNLNLYFVSAGEKKIIVGSPQKWEADFTNYFPKDTCQIIFFNADTINRYDWETIKSQYKISVKIDYSKNYLQSNDWIINYPI